MPQHSSPLWNSPFLLISVHRPCLRASSLTSLGQGTRTVFQCGTDLQHNFVFICKRLSYLSLLLGCNLHKKVFQPLTAALSFRSLKQSLHSARDLVGQESGGGPVRQLSLGSHAVVIRRWWGLWSPKGSAGPGIQAGALSCLVADRCWQKAQRDCRPEYLRVVSPASWPQGTWSSHSPQSEWQRP